MIDTLIIHLGDTKTGTTSLQATLRYHCADLLGTDWIYPGRGLNHNALAHALSRPAQRQFAAARFHAVWREVEEQAARNVILSAEHFQTVDPAHLREALLNYWPLPPRRLRLLSYVRPHLSKLIAMYSERARCGAKLGSLACFAARTMGGDRLDYAPRLARWRAVFGAAFEVRAYCPEDLWGADIVADFTGWIAGQTSGVDAPKRRLNTSLNRAQVDLMRRAGRRLRSELPPHRPLVARYLCQQLRQSGIAQHAPPLQFEAQMVGQLKERFMWDARRVDVAFHTSGRFSKALSQKYTLPSVSLSPSLSEEDFVQFDALAEETIQAFKTKPDDMARMARRQLGDAWRQRSPHISPAQDHAHNRLSLKHAIGEWPDG